MAQAGYHHANMLATQLHANMNVQTNEILSMVQHIANGEIEELPVNNTPPEPAANAIVQETVQLEMLRIR